MGIYPTTDVTERERHEDGSETWLETYNAFDGAIRTRRVTAEPYTVVWKDCFCCSCKEDEFGALYNDAACRNHGFAAARPCEKHHQPGTPWGEEAGPELEGTMPDSVQAVRLARVP